MGGLTDLCGVVNDSAAVNIAQPTRLEDGSVVVTTYDWQNYFSWFCTKVKGTAPPAFQISFTRVHLCEGESWIYGGQEKHLKG